MRRGGSVRFLFPGSPCISPLPPPPLSTDILIQKEKRPGRVRDQARGRTRSPTLSSFMRGRGGEGEGCAGEGEARRRPNSNFGRRLIFADNGQAHISAGSLPALRRLVLLLSLLPLYTGVVLARARARTCARMCLCVCMRGCVHVSRGPCT